MNNILSHILATLALAVLAPNALGQSVLFTTSGDSPSDTLGQSVDLIGDANGDGFADFMAGAWRDDNSFTNAGSVRVVSGMTGLTLFVANGDAAEDHMGFGSSGAGDVNGDGLADLCAAADEANPAGVSNAGIAKIISGNGAFLYSVAGTSAGDLFGWSTASAGDVDNDGFADIVIGAINADAPGKSNCGSATVISGVNGNLLHTFFGTAAGDNLGYSVGAAGDVDSDGFDDLIAGGINADPNGSASGQALVFSGQLGTLLHTIDGDSASDQAGRSVSGNVDIDRDGFDDLVVGIPNDDVGAANTGTVRIVSGQTGATLFAPTGGVNGDAFGVAVRGAGDLTNDGFDDIVVGATGFDSINGTNSGALFVVSGSDGSKGMLFVGDSANDFLGGAVGAGFDVNGDGFGDAIAGATGDDNNGNGSGSARIFSFVPTGLTPFGSGTAGCDSAIRLLGTDVPSVGNATFSLNATHASVSGSTFMLFSSAADGVGSNLFGVGATIHVALGSFFELVQVSTDAVGSFQFPVPIPNQPALVGAALHMQTVSQFSPACPQLPVGVGSSNGLTLAVQP